MKKTVAYIIGILASCLILMGAEPNQFVINFNPSDGLPDTNISGICQDSFNRIWVGTKRGVYYYTGYGFVSFKNKDYLSLCSSNTSMLSIDKNDRLWIFSDEGSGYYDIKNRIFTSIPQLTGISVTDADIDTKGNAWITTPEGIFRYSAENSSLSIEISDSYLKPYKSCLNNDSEIVFTANDNNLYFYNFTKKSLKAVRVENASSLGIIEKSEGSDFIVLDGEEKVCVIHTLPHENKNRITAENIFESTASISCFLSAGKTIWVGTSYGLEILDKISGEYERRFGNILGSTILGGENIKYLYLDSESNIWVGTYNSGLQCCLHEEGFIRYVSNGLPNSLRGSAIRAVCNEGGTGIWTGSEEGFLCRYDTEDKSFTNFTFRAGIPYGSPITDIDFFDEMLWISTFGNGIFVFDPVKHTSVKHYELPSRKCMSINKTSTGDIYVGTYNGLYIYDKDSDSFEIIDMLGDVFIHDVYEDSKGRLWVCSYGKGLSFINLKTFEYHPITKGINGNELDAHNIINLSEDSMGNIWIGTDTGILSKIELENPDSRYRITNYDLNSETTPVSVSGIVDGGNGRLWVATTHGLIYFDANQGKKVMTYLQNDNIVGSHFCFGGENIDKNGTIYFGTSKGLIMFDPETVMSKYTRSRLYITDLIARASNGVISEETSTISTDRITIRHKYAYRLFITFSAMNYADPNLEEYECILTRAGKENRIITSNQYITYYGLKPGKYIFSVNYAGSDDNRLSSSLTIRITAPWYLSILAKCIYGLVILTLITVIIQYVDRKKKYETERTYQIQEAQKEKELIQEKMVFMTNVTHEIRTPVSVILILLEKLTADSKTPDNVKDKLNSIRINAEKLRKYCNDILDLRKVDHLRSRLVKKDENIIELIKKSEAAFSSVITNKGISILSDLPAEPVTVNCDHEAVETIICNLLSNAVKFAQSSIHVRCRVEDGIVRVTIDNDGEHIAKEHSEKIFDAFYQIQRPDNYGSGVGLTFSRQLASMHDGKLYLDTTEEKMTSFVLELPLNGSGTKDISHETDTPKESDEISEEYLDDRLRILVVEDNEIMRKVLEEELSSQYDVCVAADGEEALGIVRTERIDLVVSDIMMPKMDGCELCNAIKGDIELSHIPVLLLTAAVGVETNLRSLQAGADAYIEKPFKMDILTAHISNLFKNRDIRNKQFASSPLSHINCSSINKVEYEFVTSLHSYILDHISEPELSIDRLANEMSMSKASLSRKVKANTGLTVNEYVRLCRLKKAVELLAENEYRINEVAYLVGYSSASYFTKIFQKQFGKLPSEFINS